MAWFKIFEGVSSDAKWPAIARKAKVNVGTVVSIWMAMLDHASQSEERGSLAGFDCEIIDALYGYEDGVCQRVMEAMSDKGIIADGFVENWEKQRNDNACNALRKDKIREEKNIKYTSSLRSDVCSELFAKAAEPPPVLTLPLNDKSLFAVTCEMIDFWKGLYPAVNVEQELRNMLGWLDANPAKRKTRNGIKGFISRWLAKEQNEGRQIRAPDAGCGKKAESGQSLAEKNRAVADRVLAKMKQEALGNAG